MSAKYKELLAQLEQEQETAATTSTTISSEVSTTTTLYPSKAFSSEDDQITKIGDYTSSSSASSPILPKGVSRKKRGTQQTNCVIHEITTIDKEFSAAANKKSQDSTTTTIVAEDYNNNEDTKKKNDSTDDEQSTSSSTMITKTVSLTKILPHIPSDILRLRIKQLSPIIDRLIDDWRTVSHHAALAPSKFDANIYPEMPKLSEVIEFSDFVKSSLDVCGLSFLDSNSLRTMQRIIDKNERVARNATENYESKEHLVLEWIFKSQASTIRALKADVEQISAFIQLREIVLNHCNSVLGCINASINRVLGVAATERTCNRERILLNELGRTRLMLTSQEVTAREEVEIQERLATLPFRDNAIRLDDIVTELSHYDNPKYQVKDLAAAHNRVKRAEELADVIMKQMRETESHEEEKWNVWNEKYSRAREKMNSAKVVKVVSSSDDDDDDDEEDLESSLQMLMMNTSYSEMTDSQKKKLFRLKKKKKKLMAEQQQQNNSPSSQQQQQVFVFHDDEYEMIVQKRVPVSVTTGKPLVDDLDAVVKHIQDEDRKTAEQRKKRNRASGLVSVGRSKTIEEAS